MYAIFVWVVKKNSVTIKYEYKIKFANGVCVSGSETIILIFLKVKE